MRAVLVLATAAILALAGATAAAAAPATEIVQGQVLRLESVQDVEAMRTMEPGAPVAWDVGVSASEPDGSIDVALAVSTTLDAYRASISSCASAWTTEGCANGAQAIFDGELVDGVVLLASQPAASPRWYRIEVELLAPIGGATADLVLSATGAGETVESGGDVTLPPTGQPIAIGAGLAITAVGAGVLLAALARRRRSEVEA